MAGLIQVLLGVVRIGRLVAYTRYSVISGFMSGIGIIIVLLPNPAFPGRARRDGWADWSDPRLAGSDGQCQLGCVRYRRGHPCSGCEVTESVP